MPVSGGSRREAGNAGDEGKVRMLVPSLGEDLAGETIGSICIYGRPFHHVLRVCGNLTLSDRACLSTI